MYLHRHFTKQTTTHPVVTLRSDINMPTCRFHHTYPELVSPRQLVSPVRSKLVLPDCLLNLVMDVILHHWMIPLLSAVSALNFVGRAVVFLYRE